MSLTLVTAPTQEPLDIEDAKLHARLDHTTEDQLVYSLIGTARRYAEDFTNRQLITAVWELQLDVFPCGSYIQLPLPPLQSVVSVKYLDTNGVEQTWDAANYVVDAPSGETCMPGRLALAYTVVWPSTHPIVNAVRIRFQCGYGADHTTVPEAIKAGLRQYIATLYNHREDNITGTVSMAAPVTVDRLLWPFRVWMTRAA